MLIIIVQAYNTNKLFLIKIMIYLILYKENNFILINIVNYYQKHISYNSNDTTICNLLKKLQTMSIHHTIA